MYSRFSSPSVMADEREGRATRKWNRIRGAETADPKTAISTQTAAVRADIAAMTSYEVAKGEMTRQWMRYRNGEVDA